MRSKDSTYLEWGIVLVRDAVGGLKLGSEPEWQRSTESAHERLQILLGTGVFHDVILGVEEEKPNGDGKCIEDFRAHMLILAMTSPVFKDDFYGGSSPVGWPGKPVVRSLGKRFTIRAVHAMLRYAYSCPGVVSFKCPVQAMETYRVAKAYKMDHLQEECGKFLQAAELSPENTVPIYEDDLHTEIPGLHEKCFGVLEAKPLPVMRIAAERAKYSTIEKFLKRENMVIPSELHLLKSIIKGVKLRILNSKRGNVSLENFLRTIFPSIRFLTMSESQFSEACEICGPAITNSEGFSIFKKISQNDDGNLPPWLNQTTQHRMGQPDEYIIPMDFSSPPKTQIINNLLFKLDITAKEGNFVFTGVRLQYELKYPPPRYVQGILDARNEEQKIAFKEKYSVQGGQNANKRLPFTKPLTVLQGETAQLILELDNTTPLEFYESKRIPGADDDVGFDVKDYNQPTPFWKLEYRPLYL